MTPPPEKGTYYAHPLPSPIVGLLRPSSLIRPSHGRESQKMVGGIADKARSNKKNEIQDEFSHELIRHGFTRPRLRCIKSIDTTSINNRRPFPRRSFILREP